LGKKYIHQCASGGYDVRETTDESSKVSHNRPENILKWSGGQQEQPSCKTPASVLENNTMVNIPAVTSTGNLLKTGACDRIPDDGFIAGTKKISVRARLLNQV